MRVLPDLLLLSRKTIAIIRQNIIGFAFGLNAVAMLSATFGILGPVAAAILHQVGSLLVLLNSMRLLVFGDWWELPPLKQVRALGASISRLDERIDFERFLAVGLVAADGRSRHASVALIASRLCHERLDDGRSGRGRASSAVRPVCAACSSPGLHLRWPVPIERVTTIERDLVRSLEIGFRATADRERRTVAVGVDPRPRDPRRRR